MQLIALIASLPRFSDLLNISIPSIAAQSLKPDAIIVVSDNKKLTNNEKKLLSEILKKTKIYFIHNLHSPGVAGAWNTGIDYINKYFNKSYIAILDDDDIWLPNHLSVCSELAKVNNADLIVSGLGVLKKNIVVAENIPNNLKLTDFLVGNPGWQGSNTFIRLSTILAAGGFTNGLISSNDKDLAINVLSIKGLIISYSKIVTVHWQCGHNPEALSASGSMQKLKGSAQFMFLHGKKMQPEQKQEYYNRMKLLFDLNKKNIVAELEKIKKYGIKRISN